MYPIENQEIKLQGQKNKRSKELEAPPWVIEDVPRGTVPNRKEVEYYKIQRTRRRNIKNKDKKAKHRDMLKKTNIDIIKIIIRKNGSQKLKLG